MCRKKQLWGGVLSAIGVGMLVACCFESGFFCCCVAVALMVAGVIVSRK